MNGKTHKIRRRLSVVALAASVAAVAIPAATAGGRYDAGLVPSKLGSPDPRDAAQENQKFTPSIVDRLVGSPDPRDSAGQGLDTPSMNEVHLYPTPEGAGQSSGYLVAALQRPGSGPWSCGLCVVLVQKTKVRETIRDAAREHGASGFGNVFLGQTSKIRAIVRDAAREHGAAGFGNVVFGQTKTKARSVIAPDYSHLPEGDRPSGTAFGA